MEPSPESVERPNFSLLTFDGFRAGKSLGSCGSVNGFYDSLKVSRGVVMMTGSVRGSNSGWEGVKGCHRDHVLLTRCRLIASARV